MSYLIQSRRLCKRLGEKNLLSDVEVHVPQGRVYALLGPNGAGKTTLMRLVLNLWKPTSGEVELFGAPLRPGDCAPLGRMGSIIEFPAFFEMLNGLENLRLHCAYMGYHRPGAAEEALERLGLGAAGNKKVKHYSLGMRQRLGLARAVLTHPELLVLDEPTAGVDPLGSRDIRNIIENLKARGLTVFLCSHLLEQVQEVCDRVGVIFKGLLIAEGSVNELTRDSDKQEILLEHASPELLEQLKELVREDGRAAWLEAGHPRNSLESVFLKSLLEWKEKHPNPEP